MSISRRKFLRGSAACSLGAAGGFALDLQRFNAYAADTSGYKALVCVFLFGGMDGHDTIIPYDLTNYNQFASIRSDLLGRYAQNTGGSTRDRSRLLPLTLANASAFPGREFAMPPELGPLHALVNSGDAAIVSNVGPLLTPIDRTQYQNNRSLRPPRLFSHNDQQSVWMSSQPEGASVGWGGRIADITLASQNSSTATFTAVSASGNTVFLSGNVVGQYQVGSNGPDTIDGISRSEFYGSAEFPALFESHLRAENETVSGLLQSDYVNVVGSSIDANRTLTNSFASLTPFATTFPNSRLGRQLSVVAQIISLRQTLGVSRQIFFVSTGGYDTHSNQATRLPQLHTDLADSMRAFYDVTQELGVTNEVTSFTASDFGRTLTINRDGTDHGWGGHHFVVGGAVQGNRMLGTMPEPVVQHQFDTNNGRLIPTTSVDQYASTLGKWFGLTDSELVDALPGLPNFSTNDIGLF